MFAFLKAWRDRKRTDQFLSLMLVARQDTNIRVQLLRILNQDKRKRHAALNAWIRELKFRSAPVSFTESITCLLDDQIADRAQRLLETDDTKS